MVAVCFVCASSIKERKKEIGEKMKQTLFSFIHLISFPAKDKRIINSVSFYLHHSVFYGIFFFIFTWVLLLAMIFSRAIVFDFEDGEGKREREWMKKNWYYYMYANDFNGNDMCLYVCARVYVIRISTCSFDENRWYATQIDPNVNILCVHN